jgi:acyl dehydratase
MTLEVGQQLVTCEVEADPGRMKTMALLRDPNPIHWDTTVLQRLGLDPRPVNQGPINASYLLEVAVRAAGGRALVKRFSVRFLANVLAGQSVICGGRVMSVNEHAQTAELELFATADGVPVLTGTATVVNSTH